MHRVLNRLASWFKASSNRQLRRRRSSMPARLPQVQGPPEIMETRTMLAANILASIHNGSLVLKGDKFQENEVALVVIDGDLVLRGMNGTTINGAEQFVVQAGSTELSRDLKVKFGNVDDTLLVGPGVQIGRDIKIASHNGNDTIGLDGAALGRNLKAKTQDGNDIVAIHDSQIAGDINAKTGIGDDTICIGDTVAGDDLKLKTSFGVDLISTEGSTIGGVTKVNSGPDADILLVETSTLNGNAKVKSGEGDDFLYTEDATFRGHAKINLGTGDDIAVAEGTNQFQGKVVLNGASGSNDRIRPSVDDVFASVPTVKGFESQDVSNEVLDTLLMAAADRLANTCGAVEDMFNTDAADDTYTVASNTTLTVDAASGVLANDSGTAYGADLTAVLVSTTTNGTLTLNSDGSFTYVPNTGFVGTDSFTYQADDGADLSDVATVTITVTGVANVNPVASPDTASTTEDAVLTASGSVLTNDTDADVGDTLTVSQVNGAAGNVGTSITGTYGSLVLNADGTYTYTLDNASAAVQALNAGDSVQDVFNYTISDGNGGTASSTLTVTVNGADDVPPTVDAVADTAVTSEDGTLSASGNVLSNDTGAGLSVTDVNGSAGNVGTTIVGTYGTLVLNADGTYTYNLNNSLPAVQALNNGESLTDVFTYTATGTGGSDASSLTVTINGADEAPPAVVAVADVAITTEDATLTASGNVLTNDTGAGLTVADVNGVAGNVGTSVTGTYGSLVLNADGTYTYTLDNASAAVQNLNAGDVVQDVFNYTATNGSVTSASTLTVTVNGANETSGGVTAVADVAVTTEDGVLTASGNVLANDTGAGLTVSDVNGAAGNVGTTITGTFGTLVLNADGTYTYSLDNAAAVVQALNNGDSVQDVFNYTASDGLGGTSSSTLTVTINGADEAGGAVDAIADVGVASEDGTLTASGNVLTNDTGAALTVSLVNGSAGNVGTSVTGTYGSLVLNADGTYTYTLNNASAIVQALASGQIVTDAFSYTVDGTGGTDSTSLTISITGANDGFTVGADVVGVSEDNVIVTTGNVLTNDTDPDATDALVVTQVNGVGGNVGTSVAGTYGSLILNADGSYTYNLNNASATVQALAAGQSVQDVFNYTATDGTGPAASTTLTVTITGANDGPIATPDSDATIEDLVLIAVGNVLTNDVDADLSDVLTVSAVNGVAGNVSTSVDGTYGSVTLNADGTYTYTLNNVAAIVQALAQGQTVQDVFGYTVSDGNGGTASTTLTVSILGTNDLPLPGPDTGNIIEDVVDPILGDVLTNDVDVDAGDGLLVVAVDSDPGNVGVDVQGLYGTVHINADGTYTYVLDNLLPAVQALLDGQTVNDVFDVLVGDSNGGTVGTTLTITVTGVNDLPLPGDDTGNILEDTVAPLVGDVLTNDVDADVGDGLIVAEVNSDPGNVGANVSGLYGTLVLNADGTYTYVVDNLSAAVQALATGESLQDVFTYLVQDDSGAQALATLTVDIGGVNDAPIVDSFSTNLLAGVLNQNLGITPPTDPDASDLLTITVTGVPNSLFGLVTLADATPVTNGQVLTPAELSGLLFSPLAALGVGSFTYTVGDGTTTTDGTVTITLL